MILNSYQKKVLILFSKGYTYKEVSATLDIKNLKIVVMMRDLMDEYGCKNMVELVSTAFREKQIE